jgi:hypothetical protein
MARKSGQRLAAFDGTYKIALDPQSYFVGTVTATIYDVPPDATAPNGSTKLAATTLSPNGQASVSLSANGTYTVTIDPQGSCFGTHQFTLTH